MDDQVDRTVYVGNLSENVSEELLFELFLQAGPLVNVVIKRPRNSQAKFAFVIFKHSQSVPYAIELFRDTKLYGRLLSIRARMESKHASSETDTTDVTPIDLQHKVLEYITQNPDMVDDLHITDPEPVRAHRPAYNASNVDDDDSYDPMSNYSVHSAQSYSESPRTSKVSMDNDEYDPYQPLIHEQRRALSTNASRDPSSTFARQNYAQNLTFTVSSNMQRRLGGSNEGSISSMRDAREYDSNSYGKRRHVEEEMLPYDRRNSYGDNRNRNRRDPSSNYTLQNPYERETVRHLESFNPRLQRSISQQDRQGRPNAYGRRQY